MFVGSSIVFYPKAHIRLHYYTTGCGGVPLDAPRWQAIASRGSQCMSLRPMRIQATRCAT